MGYQVGGQCFGTLQEASNYQMSQVLPAITADGSMKAPVFQNGQWYYNSQQVVLAFPECNLKEHFMDGVLTGLALVALMLMAFVFKQIVHLFRRTLEDREGIF